MIQPSRLGVRFLRDHFAAASSVAVGHAALGAAIAFYPGERFTLRNGILVIREHVPKSAPSIEGRCEPYIPSAIILWDCPFKMVRSNLRAWTLLDARGRSPNVPVK